MPVADLPLNILPLPDSRHVLVATSGYNAHELSLIDLGKRAVVDRQAVRESWFELAASPRFDRIWWSGGGGNIVHRFELDGPKLTRKGTDPRGDGRGGAIRGKSHFRSGLALDLRRKVLYALDIDYGIITALDLEAEQELKSASVGGRPYDVVLAQRQPSLRLRLGRSRDPRRRSVRPAYNRADRRGRAPQPACRPPLG